MQNRSTPVAVPPSKSLRMPAFDVRHVLFVHLVQDARADGHIARGCVHGCHPQPQHVRAVRRLRLLRSKETLSNARTADSACAIAYLTRHSVAAFQSANCCGSCHKKCDFVGQDCEFVVSALSALNQHLLVLAAQHDGARVHHVADGLAHLDAPLVQHKACKTEVNCYMQALELMSCGRSFSCLLVQHKPCKIACRHTKHLPRTSFCSSSHFLPMSAATRTTHGSSQLFCPESVTKHHSSSVWLWGFRLPDAETVMERVQTIRV